MSPIVQIQRRMMELGRVRLGSEKKDGKVGRKLDHFRFTSPSQVLLQAVAEKYGGKVMAWASAPEEGHFQVTTTSSAIDIVLPPVFSDHDGTPTLPFSQWLELWSGGGCQRRCDGVTEALSGKPCLCQPAVDKKGEDARACKPTTRLSFMLPDIPGLGVWRVESKGWNAASELPGTLMVLQQAAQDGKFIPAVLRLEKRTSKREGETHRYAVPVIDLPDVTISQLASGDVPLAINGPTPALPRPGIPARVPEPPADPAFANDTSEVEWGSQPALPPPDFGEEKTTPDIGTPPDVEGFAAKVPERERLVKKLLDLYEDLGRDRAVAQDFINKNRVDNLGENDKHLTWLRSQITRAENKKKETP